MKQQPMSRWYVRLPAAALVLALLHMYVLGYVWHNWSTSRFCDFVAGWFVWGALIGTMVSGGKGGICESGLSYTGGLVGVWLFYFLVLLVGWGLFLGMRKLAVGNSKPPTPA